jgi:hypothetical protein
MSIDLQRVSVVQAVAEAYLSVTQTLSAGVAAVQTVNIDCFNSGAVNSCNGCVNSVKAFVDKYDADATLETTADLAATTCAGMCECSATNIKIGSEIRLDVSAFTSEGAESKFEAGLKNSLIQQVARKDSGLLSIGDSTVLTKASSALYAAMVDDTSTLMTTLSQITSLQRVSLKGPGSIATISVTSAVDYVSNVIQKSTTINSQMIAMAAAVSQFVTQTIDSAIAQLVLRIVQMLLLIVAVVVLMFLLSFILQAIGLYVST